MSALANQAVQTAVEEPQVSTKDHSSGQDDAAVRAEKAEARLTNLFKNVSDDERQQLTEVAGRAGVEDLSHWSNPVFRGTPITFDKAVGSVIETERVTGELVGFRVMPGNPLTLGSGEVIGAEPRLLIEVRNASGFISGAQEAHEYHGVAAFELDKVQGFHPSSEQAVQRRMDIDQERGFRRTLGLAMLALKG